MAEHENDGETSKYKPAGYVEEFPIDMGELSMQVASLIDLGKEAYQKASYDLAIKYFNRALDMDPANKEVKFLKRKTMLTLSRLLEGKSKVETDEDVDRETKKEVTAELGIGEKDEKKVGLGLEQSRGRGHERTGFRHDHPHVYKPPTKDFRRGGGQVYSMPDLDKKFNDNVKKVAYRSGDSFFERPETRILLMILAFFLIGILVVSVYFGWISF